MPAGQPTSYTPERGQLLCERIAEGGLVIEICKLDDMPSPTTVYRWQQAHDEFRLSYARARTMQAQAIAEKGYIAARDATPETAAAARVQFDGGRWLSGRMDPANYGEKVATTNQQLGADGKPVDPVSPLTIYMPANGRDDIPTK